MSKSEWRDPRFRELDWLISLGQGSVQKNGFALQPVECVRCHKQFSKDARDIHPNEPQYCLKCSALVRREQNLALGGRRRRADYESPRVRRWVYLTEKAAVR